MFAVGLSQIVFFAKMNLLRLGDGDTLTDFICPSQKRQNRGLFKASMTEKIRLVAAKGVTRLFAEELRLTIVSPFIPIRRRFEK